MTDEDKVEGEDALKGEDIKSGDAPVEPVHAPTVPDDEGNVGDGTGEGDSGPASGSSKTGDA